MEPVSSPSHTIATWSRRSSLSCWTIHDGVGQSVKQDRKIASGTCRAGKWSTPSSHFHLSGAPAFPPDSRGLPRDNGTARIHGALTVPLFHFFAGGCPDTGAVVRLPLHHNRGTAR